MIHEFVERAESCQFSVKISDDDNDIVSHISIITFLLSRGHLFIQSNSFYIYTVISSFYFYNLFYDVVRMMR